ncbi:hypothetical protein AHAS_Ahas03G0251200 [Arachis hypogaea]
MDNKLKLPLLVHLLNCFLFVALSQTASNDYVEALNSLKDSLRINIPSWVGSYPCSGSWQGITCKNSCVVAIVPLSDVYLGILLEGREHFEDECLGRLKKGQSSTPGSGPKSDEKITYSIGTRLNAFSD